MTMLSMNKKPTYTLDEFKARIAKIMGSANPTGNNLHAPAALVRKQKTYGYNFWDVAEKKAKSIHKNK